MKKITIALAALFSQLFHAQDGVADASFGTNGVVVISGTNVVFHKSLMSDGKILYQKGLNIKRLMANGSADAAFGNAGQITVNQSGTEFFYNLLVQDDKILAFTGNELGWPGGMEYFAGRYNADGSLDTSFGTDGTLTLDMGDTESGIVPAFVNGTLVVAGNTVSNYGSYSNIVARGIDQTDGSTLYWNNYLNNGYNISSSSQGYSTYDGLREVVVLPNGDYLMGVSAAYYQTTGFAYARSGYIRIREGVNIPSTTLNDYNAYYGGIKGDLAFDADSNVYSLAGSAQNSANQPSPSCIIYKRNSEGNLYNAFGNGGALSLELVINGAKANFSQLAIQPDGKILVAGETTVTFSAWQNENIILARFLETGELDLTFGNNGYVTYAIPNPTSSATANSVNGLFLSADGSEIYMTGRNNENSVILKYFNDSLMQPTAPEFTQVAAICAGEVLNGLPTTSQNGISGSWAPALNNQQTTTYTFTPNEGQNALASTMTITVNQPTSESITETACESFTLNGQTYTQSGTYTQVSTNNSGCDHTLTLNLTISEPTAETITEAACESYELNGQTYTQSGTYTQVSTNNSGCDHTLTLNLTINQPTAETITEAACDFYDFNGEVFYESGTFTVTTTNNSGCDHVTTLNLTIDYASGPQAPVEQSFTEGDTVSDIEIYPSDVIWYATLEDALSGENPLDPSTELTNATMYYAVNQTEAGCRSNALAVTAWVALGTDAFEAAKVNVYPNPAQHLVTISGQAQIQSIQIFNLLGQSIAFKAVNDSQTTIDVSGFSAGTYLLKIQAEGTSQTVKLIKN